MATKIENSSELNVYMADATNVYIRTIKIPNPINNGVGMTLEQVRQAFRPAFSNTASDSSGTPCYFFYDDNVNLTAPMTQITGAEAVVIEKQITPIE